MIRKLKIKFVLIIMLLLTIVLTTLLAALFMYQKNQIYVNSVNAMKEAMAIQTTDVHSSLLIELFGLYSRSSRYPYFNTFVLEVDQVNNTITAIGYEEELDDEKKRISSFSCTFRPCRQQRRGNPPDPKSALLCQYNLSRNENCIFGQRI